MSPRKILLPLALSAALLAFSSTARAGVTMGANTSTTPPPPAPAAPPPLPPLTFGSWWNGPSMTYDWFTAGNDMRSNGVYFETDLTQFGQGLVSGDGSHAFEYGGKLDTFLHFEGVQAGTWNGFALDAHMEYLYGDNSLFHGGMLSPVNTALLLPEAGRNVVTLSSLFLTQKFGDIFTLMVGRFNTVDFTALGTYDGGRGITGFWNISMLAPLVELKTVPAVTNGAMAKITPMKDLAITFAIFDTNDSSITTGLPNLYDNGVNLMNSVQYTSHFFDLPGSQTLTGTYSNQKSTAISPIRELILPQFFGSPGTKDSTWSVAYHFDQAFYQLKDDPKKTIGVFGSAGTSDGNPNPVKYSATFGVGGHSPIPTRKDDRFGIGYYYLGISDAVTNIPVLNSRLRSEQGVEMFYTGAINKFWEVTGDIQVVDPTTTKNETDVVLGVSTRIKF